MFCYSLSLQFWREHPQGLSIKEERMNRWLLCLMEALLCVFLVLTVGIAPAAAEIQKRPPEKRLISPWLAVVDGEVWTRTLIIRALRPGPDGTIAADAGYGITDGDILPVRCNVAIGPDGVKLSVVSFYGERITATEIYDGWFIGTYTSKDGTETSVTLARIWDEALPKNRFTITADDKITLLYFGAEDCPSSASWEKSAQSAFLRSRQSAYVDLRIIKRKIHNRGPTINDFPDDLKWLYEDAEAGGVSPYFVVVVGRTVVLRTYGLANWDRKVTPLLKELTARKIIARSRTLAE
jgi:hypothetical protein